MGERETALASGRMTARPFVFRRRFARWIYLPIALLAVPVPFLVSARPLTQALVALPCLGWMVLGIRGFRSGVFLATDGVRLQTQMRTRSWPWSEVDRFVLDEGGLWVRLRDGKQYGLEPLNLGVNDPRDPVRILRDQHRVLEARRASLAGEAGRG